jgi:Predicted signal transduction protein with a C-terminal ATPase domain
MKNVFTYLRKNLSARILMLYLTFNTILMTVLGGSITLYSRLTIEQEVAHYMEKILEQASLSLNTNINDITTRIISFITYNKEIGTALSNPSMTINKQLELDRLLRAKLKSSNMFNNIVQDVFIIGENGYVCNISDRTDLIKDYPFTAQEWYRQAVSVTGNSHIQTIGLYPQDYYNPRITPNTANSDTFSIALSITNSKRNVVGAAFCTINIKELGKTLMSSNYEKSGKIALLDEENRIVSQTDNSGIGSLLPFSDNTLRILESSEMGSFKDYIDDEMYLINFQTTSLGWKLFSYVPLEEIQYHTQPISQLFSFALVICLLVNVIISIGLSRSIHKPIKLLTDNVNHVDSEHMRLEGTDYTYSELNHIAEKFDELLVRLELLIEHDYKSQIMINKFRLYSLRSQINPHFLMNTLQLLQTEIVYGNIEVSNSIVVSLSRMLRYTLYNYEKEVLVTEELNYIREYLSLFIRKFNGGLSVRYEIEDEIKRYYMPKLLLQPLIENCIEHGFSNNPSDNLITIAAKCMEEKVIFVVADDGVGMNAEQLSSLIANLSKTNIDDADIGIRNIHQRIRGSYGENYGIKIESQVGKGCRIFLTIPVIEEVNNNETAHS